MWDISVNVNVVEELSNGDLYKSGSLQKNLSEEVLGVLESVTIKTYGGVGSEISSLTGSATLIEIKRQWAEIQSILLDCGLVQGDGKEYLNENLLFSPKNIDAVILSHPHIDHVGRVPMLVKWKQAFEGFVYTTDITHDLMRIMLIDSVNLMMKKLRHTTTREDIARDNVKSFEARLEKLEKLKKRVSPNKISLQEISSFMKTINKLKVIWSSLPSHQRREIDVLLELLDLSPEEFYDALKTNKKYVSAVARLSNIHRDISRNNNRWRKWNKISRSLGSILKKLNKLQSITSGTKKDIIKYELNHQNTIEDLEDSIREVRKQIEIQKKKDNSSAGQEFLEMEEKVLFTLKDLVKVNSIVKHIAYNDSYQILTGVEIEFINAAHILGSAQTLLKIDNGKWGTYNMGFSGDLGRYASNNLWKPDTESLPELDFYQIESTYWWVFHVNREKEIQEMSDLINKVVERKWKIIIPVFMLQRMQDIVVELLKMKERWLIPQDLPIFYDWGSLDKINSIFIKYSEAQTGGDTYSKVLFPWNNHISRIGWRWDNNPFIKRSKPAIMLATWWMLEGGAVMKYLEDMLPISKNALFIVGYQAEWTGWRQLIDGHNYIDVPNSGRVYVNAEVKQFKSFSSHIDHNESLDLLWKLKFREWAKIMVNHGEADTSQSILADAIDDAEIVEEKVVKAEVGDDKNIYNR